MKAPIAPDDAEFSVSRWWGCIERSHLDAFHNGERLDFSDCQAAQSCIPRRVQVTQAFEEQLWETQRERDWIVIRGGDLAVNPGL